jgi:hypothetical protein
VWYQAIVALRNGLDSITLVYPETGEQETLAAKDMQPGMIRKMICKG